MRSVRCWSNRSLSAIFVRLRESWDECKRSLWGRGEGQPKSTRETAKLQFRTYNNTFNVLSKNDLQNYFKTLEITNSSFTSKMFENA